MRRDKMPPLCKMKEGVFIKRITTGAIIAILLVPLLFSRTEAQNNPPIVREIQIQGNKYVKEEEIRKVISTKIDEVLSEKNVREDMQAIYQMGFFSSVRALKEEVKDGVKLIFEVKENKIVSEIVFEGAEEGEISKLKGLIGLKEGKLWSFKKAKKDKERILRFYHKKGFFSALVNVSQISLEEDKCKVIFKVKKGESARVKEIKIKGNSVLSEERIKSILKTTPKCYFNERTLNDDLERVIQVYRKLGYHFAYFKEPQLEFLKERRLFARRKINLVKILLEIVEGEKVFVSGIEIEGNKVLTTSQILGIISLRQGKVFVSDYLDESIKALQDKYGENGYVYAQIRSNLEFNEKGDKVRITISIKEGPQARVGKIKIEGAKSSQKRIFKHTLLIKEGDIFNVDKLRESWRRLYNLGFFEEVEIEPLSTSSPKVLDLLVRVKEAEKKGRLFLGAGYSSISKLEGFIEACKDNLWGQGKQIGINWRFGERRNDYDISYLDRWFNDTSTSLRAHLYDKWSKYYDGDTGYEKGTRGGSLGVGWPIWKSTEAGLTFKNEEVKIGKIEGYELPEDLVEGRSLNRTLEFSLKRDKRVRDEGFNSYKGTYSFLSVEKSGGFIGGDLDFTKYQTELRGYLRKGEFWKSPILAYRLRGEFGENLEKYEYEKFYIGGQETLRGYKQNAFSADKALLGSLELRFPTSKELTVILFVDSGLWENSEERYFKTGWGFGLRIRTILGLVRLDYGIGEGGGGEFYFGLGEGF